jgi:Flp pilus assembly protein CpaB
LKRSNRLILLIGIFLALIAFVLIIVTLNGNSGGGPGASAEPTTTTMVVASRDIKLGDVIQDSDVEQSTVNIVDFPANGIKLDSLVIGQVARAGVVKGQAITTDVLQGPGGQITHITVPQGYVAMAVQVDQVSGVGTIINAGDYVDMVTGITGTDKVPLTIAPVPVAPKGSAAPAPRALAPEVRPYNPTTVKTLVQGIQVLGTLLPPPTSGGSDQPAPSGQPSTTLNGQQQIVILAVTTQEAEVIKFAQIDGNISLVLRSTGDCQAPSPGPSESASPSPTPNPLASPTATPTPTSACPSVTTTGITLRRLIDDLGVLPPQLVEVIQPTPYPQVAP